MLEFGSPRLLANPDGTFTINPRAECEEILSAPSPFASCGNEPGRRFDSSFDRA